MLHLFFKKTPPFKTCFRPGPGPGSGLWTQAVRTTYVSINPLLCNSEAVRRWKERSEVNMRSRPEKLGRPLPSSCTNKTNSCSTSNKASLMNLAGGCYTRPLTLTFLTAAQEIREAKDVLVTFVALLELTNRKHLWSISSAEWRTQSKVFIYSLPIQFSVWHKLYWFL